MAIWPLAESFIPGSAGLPSGPGSITKVANFPGESKCYVNIYSSLEFRGPFREGDCDIWEAEGVSSHGEDHAYSCIALCRKNWRAGCPALGGTRWVESHNEDSEVGKHEARHQAIELAMSMYVKNTLLRKVAHSLNGRGGNLFNWQGGKGVIWTPPGVKVLSEHRLRCHGRLIDHLGGEYYGSKDAGVGTPQLQVIAAETPFTIGLGCGSDTGEGTAHGVHSGLKAVFAGMILSPQSTTSAEGSRRRMGSEF